MKRLLFVLLAVVAFVQAHAASDVKYFLYDGLTEDVEELKIGSNYISLTPASEYYWIGDEFSGWFVNGVAEFIDDFDNVEGSLESVITGLSNVLEAGTYEIILNETDKGTLIVSMHRVYPDQVYCDGSIATYSRTPVENITTVHKYQVQKDAEDEPVFVWNDEHTSATLQVVCSHDANHTDHTEASITSDVTTAPTCTVAGERTYTASAVYGEVTYTGTVTEEIEALGHLFTKYESNNDATTEADGTKTAKCDRNGCDETDTVTDEGSKLSTTSIDNVNADKRSHARKYIENGQLIIEKEGVKYNVAGKVIIRGGAKYDTNGREIK